MWPQALLVVVGCLATAACGGDPARRSTPPASQGVEAFVEVLRNDDPAPAYALLADDLKRDLDYETFATQWKQTATERIARAKRLTHQLETENALGEQARVVYPDGQTVHLSREGRKWRIDEAIVSQYNAGRPHDAVSLFAQALENRDFDAVVQMLTSRRREGIGAQVESFVQSLNERLRSADNMVELIGSDRAEMRWNDGRKRYKLILRKEGEAWRVDDIQLQPTPTDPDDD